MTQKTLQVTGMSCGHCVAHVKKALESVEGVDQAEVSLEAGEAVVSFQTEVRDQELTEAVRAEGYDASVV